jgi:hypothetical protein
MGVQRVTITKLTCQRCGHRWVPRQRLVTICPKCKSGLWDRPKKPKRHAMKRDDDVRETRRRP